jgi:hypothetical protein
VLICAMTFFDAVTDADTMRSSCAEASAHDRDGRFRLSAPRSSPFGHCRCSLCFGPFITPPPSCPPSLNMVLLSTLLAAHRRCSTMRALTPAQRSHARQISSLTPLCLPDIPFPTTSCARTSLSQSPQRVRSVSRLRPTQQARRNTPPNRIRHPTGYPFASGCFPPRLAATQLPSATCVMTSHRVDSHFADREYSRTHWVPAFAGMTDVAVETAYYDHRHKRIAPLARSQG